MHNDNYTICVALPPRCDLNSLRLDEIGNSLVIANTFSSSGRVTERDCDTFFSFSFFWYRHRNLRYSFVLCPFACKSRVTLLSINIYRRELRTGKTNTTSVLATSTRVFRTYDLCRVMFRKLNTTMPERRACFEIFHVVIRWYIRLIVPHTHTHTHR